MIFGGLPPIDPAQCPYCAAVPAAGPCSWHEGIHPTEWERALRIFAADRLVEGFRSTLDSGSSA